MNWELVHRLNTLVIGAFIFGHLGVHLAAVASPEAHGVALSYMRPFYRDPVYETVLIGSVLIQIISGYFELRIFGKSGWRLVRNLSGAVLMLFMLIHVGMVFYARLIVFIPTDFYWVASSFVVSPQKFIAMGFYGLGVFSFFTHLIAVWVLAWRSMPWRVLIFLWSIAVILTALIVAAFAGAFYEIDYSGSVGGVLANSGNLLAPYL